MKPTVEQGLTARAVAAGQELEVFNKEILPVLDGVRSAVNFESTVRASLVTDAAGAATKRAWESEQVPTTAAWLVEARVLAEPVAGAAQARVMFALVQMTAGVPAIVGSSVTVDLAGIPPPSFGVDATAKTVYVQIIEDGTVTTWTTVIRVLEIVL